MRNTADGQYALGKSVKTFAQIWDLMEAQIDQQLKVGGTEVQVNMKLSQTSSFERVQPYARGDRVHLEQLFRRNLCSTMQLQFHFQFSSTWTASGLFFNGIILLTCALLS